MKCVRCNELEKTGSKYCDGCKIISQLEQMREWRINNKTRQFELKKAWDKANPERLKLIHKKTYESRRDRGVFKMKYRRQRAALREAGLIPPIQPLRGESLILKCNGCEKMLPRGWFSKNGKTKTGRVKYRELCRDCMRPKRAHDAAKRRNAGVMKVSPTIWTDMFVRQRGLCAICFSQLPQIRREIHIDHKVPVSKGGKHEDKNLQLTHGSCNLSKAAKLA